MTNYLPNIIAKLRASAVIPVLMLAMFALALLTVAAACGGDDVQIQPISSNGSEPASNPQVDGEPTQESKEPPPTQLDIRALRATAQALVPTQQPVQDQSTEEENEEPNGEVELPSDSSLNGSGDVAPASETPVSSDTVPAEDVATVVPATAVPATAIPYQTASVGAASNQEFAEGNTNWGENRIDQPEAEFGCDDFPDWISAQRYFWLEDTYFEDIADKLPEGVEFEAHPLDYNFDLIACNDGRDQGWSDKDWRHPWTLEAAEAMMVEAGLVPEGSLTVATPTAVPPIAQRIVPAPDLEYTPEEIAQAYADPTQYGRIGRLAFPEGESLKVFVSHEDSEYIECSKSLTGALNPSNPSWSDYSHFVWVWFEHEGEGKCVQVSKYGELFDGPYDLFEDRGNSSVPIEERFFDRLVEAASEGREYSINYHHAPDLVYHTMSSDAYTLHNRYYLSKEFAPTFHEYISSNYTDYKGVCDIGRLPYALWSNKRGFVAVPEQELPWYMNEIGLPEVYIDKYKQERELGAKHGFYLIINEGLETQSCWTLGNPGQVPVEPCLLCDLARY